jgi:AraC-like DNA-binding protein
MHPSQTREMIDARTAIPYHLHSFGYLAIVLGGSYLEFSDSGRLQVAEGDIIYHPPFQAHFNRTGRSGVRVLNLHLGIQGGATGWVGSVPNVSALMRSAQDGPRDVLAHLAECAAVRKPGLADWEDRLAWDLAHDSVDDLGVWASTRGLRRETLSRGFKRTYGATPVRFRADARARRTWVAIISTETSLAYLASQHGYADQAHMTRAINSLTAKTPGAWRRPAPRMDRTIHE